MNDRNFDDIGYKWVTPRLKFQESFLVNVPKPFYDSTFFWNFKDKTTFNPKIKLKKKTADQEFKKLRDFVLQFFFLLFSNV